MSGEQYSISTYHFFLISTAKKHYLNNEIKPKGKGTSIQVLTLVEVYNFYSLTELIPLKYTGN